MPSVLLDQRDVEHLDDDDDDDLAPDRRQPDDRPPPEVAPPQAQPEVVAAAARCPTDRWRTSTTTRTARSRRRRRSRRTRRSATRTGRACSRRTRLAISDTTSTTTAPTATTIGSTACGRGRAGRAPATCDRSSAGRRSSARAACPTGRRTSRPADRSAAATWRATGRHDSASTCRPAVTRSQRTGDVVCDDRAMDAGRHRRARCGRRRCPADEVVRGQPLDRRPRRRRGHRRRRLHRPVDGATTSPPPIPACASPSSSASTSASAPAAATAAGARRCWRPSWPPLAARHGRDAAIAMQRAMHDTVDEVGRVAAASGRTSSRAGTISLARTAAQHARLAADVDEARTLRLRRGRPPLADGGRDRRHVSGESPRAPRCSRRTARAVHPLRLAHAIARACVDRGRAAARPHAPSWPSRRTG